MIQAPLSVCLMVMPATHGVDGATFGTRSAV